MYSQAQPQNSDGLESTLPSPPIPKAHACGFPNLKVSSGSKTSLATPYTCGVGAPLTGNSGIQGS